MKKILLLSITFISCFHLLAIDYYVSPSGNDSKSGTSIDNAWKTPSKVSSFAWSPGFAAGDRIFFEGGKTFVMTSEIYIQLDKSFGTAASPITISSYGTGKAILKAKGCNAFNLWAPSTGTVGLGYRFTNLIIEGDSVALSGPKNTKGIAIWNSSSSALNYLLVEDVEIRGFAGNGIETGRDAGKGRITNITIRRVVSHHNPGGTGISPHTGSGIIVAGADGALIEHCIAYKNGIKNNNPGGPIGIWFWDAINSTIQYCESYDNETTNGDGGGFDLDGGCQNCIIQYCYSHNNAGAGYLFAQFLGASTYGPLKNNIVRYNISQNDGRKGSFGGISFWGNDATNKVDVNYIYNNTVYQGGTASDGMPSCVYFLGGNCSGVKIWNNIFIAASNYYLINATTAMDTTKVHFQNNDYWVVSGTTFKIKWGGTTYNTLADWQTAVPGAEKINNITNVGLVLDPQLNNAGNGGTIGNTLLLPTLTAYKLKTTSELIGKGLDLTKAPYNKVVGARDYYGNSIPQGGSYDLGAHDTISTSPVPVLSASPTSLAFGNVTVNTISAEKTYVLTGSNLTADVTVTAPAGYEVSKTSGSGFGTSVTVTPSSGSVNQTIYVRFKPTLVQAYNGNIANASTGATTQNVALTGSGIAATYTITFNVIDSKNAAISGASVTFNSQTLTTNASGQAVFSNVSSGSKTYTVAKTGYITVNSSVNVTGSATVNVSMSKQKHTLTVIGGTGTGSYEEGTVVAVVANPAPKDMKFKKWTGSTTILADSLQASTLATIGTTDASITAVYEPITNTIEAESLSVEVYPVPCKENVYVKISGAERVILTMYNMLGCKVYEQMAGTDQTTIRLNGLNQGIYLIKIQKDDHVIIRRIVIE